ncbi:MAG: GTPase ObgE [Candidatus Saccharibacteria bacterium]
MFYDQAKIFVKGGDGGSGVAAFRREKYVPMGGPSGGDGGRGGSVIFIADEGLRTLMDFRYRRHYKADRGEHGQGKNMHGANAEDLVIKVPVGTVIKDADTGDVIADLVQHGQSAVAAKGGRGGRGNARFSSSVNRAPSYAEKGEPGKERWLLLELKLLADVGLVGFPNAGKSTLISKVSAAKPKIADYPFTTLSPNLGVVDMGGGDSFVIADIPGIIEGAHTGAGLGLEFLRHIERTRVLIFVLDCSGTSENGPVHDYQTLLSELRLYRPDLEARPRLIAANKIDVSDSEEVLHELQKSITDIEIFPISALTGEGLDQLIRRTYVVLCEAPEPVTPVEEMVVTRYKEEAPFIINVVDGVYEVSGERIEKLVAMTDLSNDEALARFQRTIQYMGLEDALKARGVKVGDLVRISELEFEYME